MKLRQLPEDFRVEEINDLPISKEHKNYSIYMLEKKGMETFSLVRYLSKANDIPYSNFGIAGLKDRHAVTMQYISIPSKYSISTLHEKNFNLTFLGYSDKGIMYGGLSGNRFEIVVRNIRKGELDNVYQKSKTLELIGVPNYFDSQRFGSVINNTFIAKFIINKDYEGAVKAYLTSFSRHESSKVKQEKRLIAERWDDISGINVSNHSLASVIGEYKKTKSWLSAYKKIMPNIREMIVSAYQSYLWNECIKEVLQRSFTNKMICLVKYNAGTLAFYKGLGEKEKGAIPKTFSTISHEIAATAFELDIINKVLAKESCSLKDFDIRNATGNFFKARKRQVIIKPSQLSISQPLVDELNGKNFKVKLSFSLPKGSFATVITKRLFNQ